MNDTSALSLTAFYRGVSMIASAVAGLPLHVMRESAEGAPQRLRDPDTAYLWSRPNSEMTRVTFWERVVADEVRGNAFIWVEKDQAGGIAGLWHIERQRMRVGRTEAGEKVYLLDGEEALIDYKNGGEIVHIPNWGDGMVGYDIVKLAAQAIALGLSAEEYAARTFANNGVPPGLITSEMELTPQQAEEISIRWHATVAGTQNAGRVPVMGKGAKFQQINQDLEKTQMDALRKFQKEEILTLLGLPEGSTTWHAIAEQGQEFVRYCLDAHITRIKQAVDDNLLVRELTGRYCIFDPGGFLRGSIEQQYNAHDKGIKGSFITQNDARRDLDLEPLEGADDLLVPLNMGTARDRELQRLKVQAEAVGQLIRAGFVPDATLAVVGLPAIAHTGRPPVTVGALPGDVEAAPQEPVEA